MDTDFSHRETGRLTDRDRIGILVEEYRALGSPLLFRLTAMDRRLPMAGGTLGVLLGSVTVMPPETRLIFLIGLPTAPRQRCRVQRRRHSRAQAGTWRVMVGVSTGIHSRRDAVTAISRASGPSS